MNQAEIDPSTHDVVEVGLATMHDPSWLALPVKSITDPNANGILWRPSDCQDTEVSAARNMSELLDQIDAWQRGQRPVLLLDIGNGDYDVAYFGCGVHGEPRHCWEITPFVRANLQLSASGPYAASNYRAATRPTRVIRFRGRTL